MWGWTSHFLTPVEMSTTSSPAEKLQKPSAEPYLLLPPMFFSVFLLLFLNLYSCLDRGALGEPEGQKVRSTDREPYCGPTGNVLWLDLSSFM